MPLFACSGLWVDDPARLLQALKAQDIGRSGSQYMSASDPHVGLAISGPPWAPRHRAIAHDRDKRTFIVGDIRLDNPDEVRAAIPTSALSEASLVLAAYHAWGEGFESRLEGDFAFAIWNGRRQHWYCVRDRFGVKPFYYFCDRPPMRFAWSTRIAPLMRSDGVDRNLDELSATYHLLHLPVPADKTFVRSIARLPPASRLVVTRHSHRVERYWRLDPTLRCKHRTAGDYETEFRHIFETAVSRRVRNRTGVASMLSGGMDSSSVTLVANGQLQKRGSGDRLVAVSAVFDELKECDETPYIQAVIGATDAEIDHHRTHPEEEAKQPTLSTYLSVLEGPVLLPGFPVSFSVARTAASTGAKCLLTGFDGDVVLSHASGWQEHLLRRGRWSDFAREFRAFRANGLASPSFLQVANRILTRGIRRSHPVQLLRRYTGRSITPYLSRSRRHQQQAQELLAEHASSGWDRKTIHEKHFGILTSPFVDFSPSKMGSVAGSFGMEALHPFWDRDLVEFCYSLPLEQRIANGYSRVVLRNALSDVLPSKIRLRPKKTLLTPLFARASLAQLREAFPRLQKCSGDLGDILNLSTVRDDARSVVSSTATQRDVNQLWELTDATNLLVWRGLSDRRSESDGIVRPPSILEDQNESEP